MNKKLLVAGSLLGILGIILGAFAAHGLKELVSEASIQSFETGVRYQIYHAFLFLILGNTSLLKEKTKKTVFFLVILGVLFFSGSIYGLATDEFTAISFKRFALITPIGGLLLISAWVVLLINFLKLQKDI